MHPTDVEMMVSAPRDDLERFIGDPNRFEPPGRYRQWLGAYITAYHRNGFYPINGRPGQAAAQRPLDDCHLFFSWAAGWGGPTSDWLAALATANPTLTIALTMELGDDEPVFCFAFARDGEVDWLAPVDGATIDTFLQDLAHTKDWLRAACVEAAWHAAATWCGGCGDFVTGAAWVGWRAIRLEHQNGAHQRTSSGVLVSLAAPVLGLTP